MEHFFTQLKKRLFAAISMTDKEKSRLRHRLLLEMDRHPVRVEEPSRHHGIVGRWFNTLLLKPFNNPKQKSMPILLILALLVAGGGGTAVAAEQALPGDVLYPVKVEVTEEVRGALSFNTKAKAQWEARRIERRLEETQTLASIDDLDEEKLDRITERFERHADRVESLLERLEERDDIPAAANIAARLEASLDAHQRILDRMSNLAVIENDDDDSEENEDEDTDEENDRNDNEDEEANDEEDNNEENDEDVDGDDEENEDEKNNVGLGSFLRNIKMRTGTLASSQNKFDAWAQRHTTPDVRQAAEQKRQATERKLAQVERFVERRGDRAHQDRVDQAEAFLGEANDVYQEGVSALESEEHARAFRLFQVAWKMAHRSMVAITAQAHSSVDIDLGDEDEGEEQSEDESNEEDEDEENSEDETSEEDEEADNEESDDSEEDNGDTNEQ